MYSAIRLVGVFVAERVELKVNERNHLLLLIYIVVFCFVRFCETRLVEN